MAALFASFASGALFGCGLAISRMADRSVVLGFLDVAGEFDPTLLFVIAAAVAVTVVTFRFVLRQPSPVFADEFKVPGSTAVDGRLLAGAAVFGIGWGLAGFCPGPRWSAPRRACGTPGFSCRRCWREVSARRSSTAPATRDVRPRRKIARRWASHAIH